MTPNRGLVTVSPGRAELVDLPYPTLPRDDYIIVKGTAFAVNPSDHAHIDMTDEQSCAGCHVGCDYAGVVVEVGPGVTKDFKKGDRIAGAANGGNILQKTDGAFAHYFTVKGNIQMKVPDNIPDEEAATQGVSLVTVGQSLYRDLGLPLPSKAAAGPNPSPILFIYGGSTAMGIAGIQFAKLSGAVVIATASPRNFEYLQLLGADHVVDYHSASLVDDVRQLAGGRSNIRLAWDCRPSDESAAVCADVLADDPSADARYSALLTDTDAVVRARNPAVATFVTLAYSALGEDWFYGQRFPPSFEDHEFLKSFIDLSTELLAQGKLKAPRIYLNEGGKGLEGLLHGIQLSRTWAVSAGKLVYTLE